MESICRHGFPCNLQFVYRMPRPRWFNQFDRTDGCSKEVQRSGRYNASRRLPGIIECGKNTESNCRRRGLAENPKPFHRCHITQKSDFSLATIGRSAVNFCKKAVSFQCACGKTLLLGKVDVKVKIGERSRCCDSGQYGRTSSENRFGSVRS